jgi:hypothetical protein
MNTRSGLVRSWAILAFATGYLVFQLAMIVGAHGREDKRFGFWMFAESSDFQTVLIRELGSGERVQAPQGAWTARGAGGAETTYRWGEFVREFHLGYVETFVHAKTGMYVTLKYLGEALDYVIVRIPEDHETVRLHLVVRYSKAGGPLEEVVLSSKRREPGR